MLKSLTSMTDIDRRERSRESAWTHCLMVTKDYIRWLLLAPLAVLLLYDQLVKGLKPWWP